MSVSARTHAHHSLYCSSTHSRAERLPSRYSQAWAGMPASVVRSSRVIVPPDLSARSMARFGSTPSRSCRSSGYGSADSNPAGARLHGHRRNGQEGAAAGAGQRRRLADHGAAQRQRRRDDHPAEDHGLRRPGRHLHRGRQEAGPPAGVDGRRAGPVGSNNRSKHTWTHRRGWPTARRRWRPG